MSGRRALELCPHLRFVEGHFDAYQRLGDAALKVLSDYTPLVERLSIDEAFADVAGCERLFGPPEEIATTIRRRVRDELGLPISVGVARTKDLPEQLMWGAGPATEARLAAAGVLKTGQLAQLSEARLSSLLGRALGMKLAALAWNRDARVIRATPSAQSAGAQYALGRRPAQASITRPILWQLADRIGTQLRAKRRPGRTMSVRVRFADLRAVSRSVTLAPAGLGDGNAGRNRRRAGTCRAGEKS
jgi:DNA polymerase-4